MRFCYAHRLLSCLVIINETSSWSIWEQIHRSIDRQYLKNGEPGNTQPEKGCIHQIPLLGVQGTTWKRRQKYYKSQRGGRDEKTRKQFSIVNMIKANMSSQKLRHLGSAPGPLPLFYGFLFSIFMWILILQRSDLYFLCFLFGYFLLFVLFQF